MQNMYNATMQNGASVGRTSGCETAQNTTNPMKRNRLVPPPIDGLASKEYANAVRSLAFAQINLPKYYMHN